MQEGAKVIQPTEFYHTLHTLFDEEDDKKFELLFNNFMTCIDNNESTQCFAKYFKLEYCQHKHQLWKNSWYQQQ